MEYILLGSILIIVTYLVIHHFNKQKLKNEIELIRQEWGRPKRDDFNFVNIKRYSEVVKEEFHRLTDQTIEDIDFNRLFSYIDRTTSKVGQQFLYKKLIEPSDRFENPSENLVRLFTSDAKLREEIQMELLKLNNNDAYYISSLLREERTEKPKWFNLLIIDLVLFTILILLSFKFLVVLPVLIVPITLNMFLHYWNKSNILYYTRSIPQLNRLINISKQFLKREALVYDTSVTESISDLKSFQGKARLIKFDDGGGIQGELGLIASYFLELIKALFLIEVFLFFKVVRELENKQSSIKTLFNYVGNIDTSISIASLRAGKLKTCQPVLVTARKEITVKNIYHPLIKNCVKNDLTICDRSILITGSNMSGKSTFLRTMMINSILAQTIYTCFADEFVSPILKQFSSIRIDDNLFEGKSYYFQEVSTVGSLLTESESVHQNLFVLDEVFKGTNTIERIAAAKAILSYLNRNQNIVVVSTHDIELAAMLDSEYDLYHFKETIENNELHFDHTIKRGQLTTRNAIKLLEIANYPAEIINEAKKLSTTIRATQPIVTA